MKIKVRVIYEVPEDAVKKRKNIRYRDFHDPSSQPLLNRYFLLKNGMVYETVIRCPVLCDLPSDTLLSVEELNQGEFIIDTDCIWPVGVARTRGYGGFIERPKTYPDNTHYLFIFNDGEGMVSHLDIPEMKDHYQNNASEYKYHPLITVEIIS